MTASLGARIRFLRDCYEADNRESAIWDLSAEKIRHLNVPLMGGQFLCGAIDRIPIEREAALALQSELSLKRAEKSLVLGGFVLAGSLPPLRTGARRRRLLAPLLVLPAQIEDAAPYAFLRADPEQARLNTRVLAALEDAEADAALDELADRLPPLPLAADRVDELVWAFKEVFPRLDLTPLEDYPQSVDQDSLLAAAGGRGAVRVFPAAAMALVPISPDTRHVLAELNRLAESERLSPPLTAVLEPERGGRSERNRVRLAAPTALSAAQRQVVRSTMTAPLRLIVGPPGSGKSHTVAAAAMEHALTGQSVLITARTEQAVEVLQSKLAELAGGELVIRGGRGEQVRRLRETIDGLLEGRGPSLETVNTVAVRRLCRRARQLRRRADRLEAHLQRRVALELGWGEPQVVSAQPGLRGLLARQRLRLRDWRLRRRLPYWERMAEYQQTIGQLHACLAQQLPATIAGRRVEVLEHHRRDLQALGKALRARTKRKLHEYFATMDVQVLLRAFPIWLTTVADVGEMLPLKPELFDLAIVDEATQCDPASLLPVLHRARRAAVTGDPRQLRHVSFLSDSRLATLADRHGLEGDALNDLHFRKRSALDLVNAAIGSQRQVVLLDEHFRSLPQIIGFSNREFYDERLKIMTQRPETVRRRPLELRRVEGLRSPSGHNRAEAEAVVAELEALIASERALEPSVAQSLGVLSPFREQVDHISSLVTRRIPAEAIQAHRLLVATPYGFQGEERDVMLVSLAVDANSPAGSYRFVCRDDVFNVAVTRARYRQVVFTSLPEAHPTPGLLGRYLSYLQTAPSLPRRDDGEAGALADEVAAALERLGCRCWHGFPVAGREVDLVVERRGSSLGIDLVGAAGRFQEAFSLERYRTLGRAGLSLMPLPLSTWRRDPETCLAAVDRWLESCVGRGGR